MGVGAVLDVRELRVAYGGIEALKGVSFTVAHKEIVTLIGSNGAGKSSTLRSISNLVRKSGGSVRFEGNDISDLDPSEIVKMGICHIPEGRRIFPHLTVEENLLVGGFGAGCTHGSTTRERLDSVYGLFPRLKERRRQHGGTLSGGEQQMLAIGRGLMLDPKLVMLDEPSLGLAPIIVEQIFDLIVTIRDLGKTILLIEQNAAMALGISDRGYVMEMGRIVLSGKAADLMENPDVARAYLGIG